MSNGQTEKTPDIGRTLAGHLAKNPYSEMTGQGLSDHLGIDVVAVYKQTKRAGIDGWASKKPMEYGTILAICRQYAHRNAVANSILVREKAVQDNFNLSMSEIENEVSEINIPVSVDENDVSECPLPVSGPQPASVRQSLKVQMPRIGVEHLLSLIVIGHSALVLNEMTMVFPGGPGLYGGIAVFAFKVAAVWIALDKRFSQYAHHARAVCFCLDFLATWVHKSAFLSAFNEAEYGEKVDTVRNVAINATESIAMHSQAINHESSVIVCWCIAVVISSISFSSLLFGEKISNLEK